MLNRTIKKAKLYSPTINKRFKKLSVKRRDYLQKCDLNRAVNHFKFPKIKTSSILIQFGENTLEKIIMVLLCYSTVVPEDTAVTPQ